MHFSIKKKLTSERCDKDKIHQKTDWLCLYVDKKYDIKKIRDDSRLAYAWAAGQSVYTLEQVGKESTACITSLRKQTTWRWVEKWSLMLLNIYVTRTV